jgi:nucleoside-diphosphate-sugar epimerase
VLAGMRLVDRAKRQGVKQFIFASSGSVYGVKEEPQVVEDLELVPISEYNKTKMVAERVVESYRQDMVATSIRPATVCGYSPRMRLDVVVNMLTIQALTRGVVTVLGGDQVRPNIHIDDLVDLYLFAFDKRLAGIYNAGFENISVMDIAKMVTAEVPARIDVKPSNDPRSYRVSSEKLLATGFKPTRTVRTAIHEMVDAYRDGRITDDPVCYNVRWMKQHHFG